MAQLRVKWRKRTDHTPVLDGQSYFVTVGAKIEIGLGYLTPASVILGPYCVEAGAVFLPGPERGLVVGDSDAGQVGC